MQVTWTVRASGADPALYLAAIAGTKMLTGPALRRLQEQITSSYFLDEGEDGGSASVTVHSVRELAAVLSGWGPLVTDVGVEGKDAACVFVASLYGEHAHASYDIKRAAIDAALADAAKQARDVLNKALARIV